MGQENQNKYNKMNDMEPSTNIDELVKEVDTMKFDLEEWLKNNELKNDQEPKDSFYLR